MAVIKLKSLSLTNFKGTKERTINFSDITTIEADNGKGKTTITDAWNWLLFNKDSNGSTAFNWKPLDKDGNEIHNLETSVTAVIAVDDREIAIRKTTREKWAKQRGQASKIYAGNETEYCFDDVILKECEYKAKIKEIADEKIFRLITNTGAFASMKWQEQRNILIDILENILDEDIFNSNIDLKPLESLMKNKTIEELKTSVKARRRKINDELKTIPARIDENYKNIPEELINIDELREQLDIKQTELSNLTSGISSNRDMDKLIKEVNELKSIQNHIVQDLRKDIDLKKEALFNQLKALKSKAQKLNMQILDLDGENERLIKNIDNTKKEKESLVKCWKEVKQREFICNENDFICPSCGRAFDYDDAEEKRAEMLKNFNSNKAKELEEINKKGFEAKKQIESLESKLSENQVKKETLSNQLDKSEQEIKDKDNELNSFETDVHKILENNQEYTSVSKKIDVINKKIDELSVNNQLSEHTNQREAEKEIQEIQFKLNENERRKSILQRIEELKEEEKNLAQKLLTAEKTEDLCNEFIRTKISLLEEKINNKFQYVSFKLFNQLQNGNIEDTCEILVNGVPYSSASKSETIKAGLDVINVLSEKFNIIAPVFIDNRESINELFIDTQNQIINLRVSKDEDLVIKEGF